MSRPQRKPVSPPDSAVLAPTGGAADQRADQRALVTGGNTGQISTGDHTTNVQVNAEAATLLPSEAFKPVSEIAAPVGLVNIPIRPGLFVGRAKAQADLDAGLAGTGAAVVQAVYGLGGIGKSTLAAHYAATHAGDFDVVWWITANSAGAIEAGLADLAIALQPALAGLLPPQALRERAMQWLAHHRRWLLVLDNVEDPADIAPVLAPHG